MAIKRPLVRLASCVPFCVVVGLCQQAGAQQDQPAQAIEPANYYCDDGSARIEQRRPGVPVDVYQLPPCSEADSQRIRPWTDPVELGPPVPDRWRIVNHI